MDKQISIKNILLRVNKIFLTICFILFFLLLPWPGVVIISYMFFTGLFKAVFIIALWALELINGAFIIIWLLTNRNNMKMWIFVIVIMLVGLCYLACIGSFIYVYIFS